MKRAMFVMACALCVMTGHSVLAQSRNITCTGTLIDLEIKPGAEWPLAVIYDVIGRYACSIDRTGSGHDPLSPCSLGEKCRITGTYRKIGQTYPSVVRPRSLAN